MIYTLEGRRLETADEDHFIAPGAQVIGSVRLGRRASIWFGCVLRADDDWIIVGDGTNILTSRADSVTARLASCAVAALVAKARVEIPDRAVAEPISIQPTSIRARG